MDIDIIIPLLNEEGNIEKLHQRLSEELCNLKYNLIFIDDGSVDNSLNILKSIYKKDKQHIKIISFSRNFGKDSAIYAGMCQSSAKYTCIIDADLQQNPKYIIDMYNFLEKNAEYDEVAMVNSYENDSKLNKYLKQKFYKIISKTSNQVFKEGASDFRLLRNNVTKTISNMKEFNRFTKGLFAYAGFKTYYMNYKVEKRNSGTSKFKFKNQLRYAKEGIINFSTKPLKLATIVGSLMSSLSFIYLIITFLQTIINGKSIPGYASLLCVILLLGGIQLLFLGIIGEYIAKIYTEIKNRPIYIEKERIGFDDTVL